MPGAMMGLAIAAGVAYAFFGGVLYGIASTTAPRGEALWIKALYVVVALLWLPAGLAAWLYCRYLDWERRRIRG